MSDLLPIGRFAECTGLTPKALRLYDKLGLLPPALVDCASGYRYYSTDQMVLARGIQMLRALDMPLDDIAVLLKADNRDTMQAALDRQWQRIKEQIRKYEVAQRHFPTVDEWCRYIGREESMATEQKTYTCSFCGKSNDQIRRMIAGPKGVFICNECIEKCNEIIADEEGRSTGSPAGA